jgi:hypothetical protein
VNAAVNLLIRAGLKLAEFREQRPFLRATRDPDRTQQALLMRILQRHRHTRFGQAHGFHSIRDTNDFAARVPIADYEDLRPWIDRQENDGNPELVPEKPRLYARTSGSTGTPKLIPVSQDTIARHHRDQKIFSCCHARAVPGLFDGSILAFVSPAIEGHLPSGTAYGSMSGLIYGSMPRLMRRKYLVPAEVFALSEYDLKYLLIATFAAADPSVTYVAAANPSSFLKLARVIWSEADTIVEAVESGELPGGEALDDDAGRRIRAAFRGNPKRARELRVLFAGEPTINAADLWPDLKAVSCWREGSCRVLLPELQKLLPDGLPVLEMGYLSSECRGSLPVSSLDHREVPTFHENYFEFVERGDWEAGCTETSTLTELECGKIYHVIVTTQDGLYRYFMNDLVMVDGWFNRTPTIHFLEKGTGVTSITGEKLHEGQVIAAVADLVRTRQGFPEFFILVADPERQRYLFYAEEHGSLSDTLAAELDAALAERNLEYESKRASGRLHPIEVRRLQAGTGEAYKAHLIAKGQREAQFKFLRLQSRDKLNYELDQHLHLHTKA